MMESLANRTEIVVRIRQEINAQSTGTLILHSKENHVAMLGFDKGALVSLFCAGLRGSRALTKFLGITGGTSRFDKSLAVSPQRDLPATEELLALMEGFRPAEAEQAEQGDQVSEATIAAIAQVLAEYVGPIAPLLCKTHRAGNSVADARNMIEKLAGDIPDEAQRRQFIADARSCLEKKE